MTLEDIINSGDPREIKRAIAVKMSESGATRAYIGSILGVGPDFVTKWNSVYRKSGAEGLKLSYIGSKGYLDEFDRYDIIKYIKSCQSITVEALADYIESEFNIKYSSKQSYYQLLHDAGMSWKKTEKINPKRNQEQVTLKKEEIKKNWNSTKPT